MESDVYAPSTGPNVTYQGYKGMICMITKFSAQHCGLIILRGHVVLELKGMLNPRPLGAKSTPN